LQVKVHTMTQQHQSEDVIFEQARLQASSQARLQFVEQACAGNEPLKRRVLALLAAHEAPCGPLDALPPGINATLDNSPERAGIEIGPYKLIEQIGEGGMGTVWMAQQTQPVKRLVAVKLIKAGMDSRQVIARFGAERQALAIMDHTNIARVLDVGTTSAGRPYFVMDLVRGVPITRFCDEHRLTPRQRLELFVPVCQAIQHAHQKGIIHRDLKPSNVLVALYDGQPVPKVIDFGVAKATGQPLTEQTLVTGFGNIVGTLEYMSPEQAEINQLDIDTRSDIYSLGVLLYELLTGSTPFSRKVLEQVGMLEMLRVIREEEPSKPSTKLSTADGLPTLAANRGTEPARLTKLVRGELDWIVMKALEKDRNRRYETAAGLAADLRRYLIDDPVQAGPPSTLYRLRKFTHRHKGPVLAVGVVFLALLGGIIGTTWGLLRAEHARRAEAERAEGERQAKQQAFAAANAEKAAKETAEARKAETQAVLKFVEDKVLAAARPKDQDGGLGRDVQLRAAIEAALPFVESSFKQQPLIEARLRLTLGTSFDYLGEAKRAAEQFQAARTLFSKHLGPDEPLTFQSMTGLANSYGSLGLADEALRLREEVLEAEKAKFGPEHPETLRSMMGLANSYGVMGRRAEALNLREAVLAIQKRKLGARHPDTLTSMFNLATGYSNVGRNEDAVKLFEELLPIQRATLGSDHPHVLRTMAGLANVYGVLGRRSEALQLREDALAIQKTNLGPDHPDTLRSMHNLATAYSTLGRLTESAQLREETLALRRTKLGADHPDTLLSMWGLAASLVSLDRSAEAVPLIDECVQYATRKVVDPRLIPGVMNLRLRHFEKMKDVAGVRLTAAMWEQLNRTDVESLYIAAQMRAIAAAVITNDEKTADVDATRLAKQDADRAMVWLRQAVAAGYQNVELMKEDNDLIALRSREDFEMLLAELKGRAN
jgi:eukaryotic-like serine/threonine-protein kinase